MQLLKLIKRLPVIFHHNVFQGPRNVRLYTNMLGLETRSIKSEIVDCSLI